MALIQAIQNMVARRRKMRGAGADEPTMGSKPPPLQMAHAPVDAPASGAGAPMQRTPEQREADMVEAGIMRAESPWAAPELPGPGEQERFDPRLELGYRFGDATRDLFRMPPRGGSR